MRAQPLRGQVKWKLGIKVGQVQDFYSNDHLVRTAAVKTVCMVDRVECSFM